MFQNKTAISLACVSLFASVSFASSNNSELNPVTIYGVGFGEAVAQALPQTEIITSSKIQKSGLNTVGDILEKLGNIYMRQDLGANMNASPDIRGYGATSSNNTIILIDGIKISQNEQAPARTWNIPVESIDHIEIIRGSSSVLYGEGATSGIINIITNKQKENIGVLSVGTGSYGTQTTNAFLSKTTESMKLSIFGKTTNSNGFRDQSESRLKSGGIQLDHQINESASTGLRYAEDRNYANLPGYLSLTKYTQNPNQAQSSLSSLYDNRAVNSTITSKLTSGYLKYRDGDFSYLIDIARKDSKIDYMNTSWYEDDLYTSTQDAINGKVKIDNFLSPNNTLVAGLSSSRSHRNARVFDLPVTSPNSTGYTSQNGKAIFAQNDWKFTDVDRFTFGVRREYFKQSTNGTGTYWDSNFNPHPYNKVQSGKNNLNAYELQYSKDISNAITNYVKIGQSYRLPNVDDLSRPCNSISCIDNLALKPQTNKDFEIGSIYNSGPNRGYFKYYQSIITDEILFDKSSNNWVGLNLNIPKTRRKGLEYYNSHSYDSHLAINTSISLIESIFLVDSFGSTSGIYGKNISGTPNYILGIGFDYSINAKNTVSWNSRLIGNQYPQGDNNNFYKLDSYSLSDFSYRWSDKKWSVVANINNVFDKKYGTAILASQSNPNSVNYPYVMYPNWGRNFLITLRYAFE